MACTEILERELALQMIDRTLADARNQKMSCGFLIGTAGLGKSLLLAAASQSATDFAVGWSKNDEIGSGIALGSIWRSISALGVKNPFAIVKETSLADRLATASLWLMEWVYAQRDRPVLLILDDLHWADAGSLALLNHLVLSQLPSSIAILGAARPWPNQAKSLIHELTAAGASRLVELEPLSNDSARDLICCHTGTNPDPSLLSQAQIACGGNPLLLIHFAKDISGSLARDYPQEFPVHSVLDTGEVAVTSSRLDIHRLIGNDPQTVRFARVSSAMGDEFPLSVVLKVVGSSSLEAIDIVDRLVQSGVFSSEISTNIKFSHSLIREIIYESIQGPLRMQVHQAIFRELMSLGYGPEWCASHAGKGELKGDRDALEVTVQAGDLAAKLGDIQTAIRWYSQALALMGNLTPPETILHICSALVDAGEPQIVVHQLTKLLQLQKFHGTSLARAKHLKSKANYALGEIEISQAECQEAARLMSHIDPDESAIYLLELALNTFYTLGPRHVNQFVQEAILRLGTQRSKWMNSVIRSIIEFAEINLDSLVGDVEYSVPATIDPPSESEIIFNEGSPPSLPAWIPALSKMQVAKFREEFSLVEEYYQRANREFDLGWRPLTRSYFDIAYADTLTRTGRLDEARSLLETLSSLGPLLRSRRTWVEVGLANICFHQGELEIAYQHLDAVREALRSRPDTWYPMLRFWQAKAEVDIALYKGELAAAGRGAQTMEKLTTQSGVHDPNSAPWHNTAIAAYMANGQFSEVRRIIDILSKTDTFSHLKTPRAIVSYARALLCQAEGVTGDAEDHFNNAISIYQELGMPLDEANTLLSYGSFIRKHFGAKLARPVLTSALELSNSHGALTLSNQIVAELRLAHGRVSKKSAEGTILTPAQQRVQAYVLNGLSNREIANALFVSPRTVEHHISALLKLYGVNNRKELRQVLAHPSTAKIQNGQFQDLQKYQPTTK